MPLPPLGLGYYLFTDPFARWERLEHGAGIVAIVHRLTMDILPYRPLCVTEADDLHEARKRFPVKGGIMSLYRASRRTEQQEWQYLSAFQSS